MYIKYNYSTQCRKSVTNHNKEDDLSKQMTKDKTLDGTGYTLENKIEQSNFGNSRFYTKKGSGSRLRQFDF